MSDIGNMLATVRGRALFNAIASGEKRRMPCGDARIAERLRAMGALRLIDPTKRDLTTSWVLTELGETYNNGNQ